MKTTHDSAGLLCVDHEERAKHFRRRLARMVKNEVMRVAEVEGVTDFTTAVLTGMSTTRNPGQAVWLSLVDPLCQPEPLTKAIERGGKRS